MNVTYACPRCEQTNRATLDDGKALEHPTALVCSGCGLTIEPRADAWENGTIRRCLVCPGSELYLRKAFPQRLGVAIVALGFLASSAAWFYHEIYLTFGILGATAICDLVLYWLVGNALMCYRCGAQYRGLSTDDRHAPFSLETHERYRQETARRASRT